MQVVIVTVVIIVVVVLQQLVLLHHLGLEMTHTANTWAQPVPQTRGTNTVNRSQRMLVVKKNKEEKQIQTYNMLSRKSRETLCETLPCTCLDI